MAADKKQLSMPVRAAEIQEALVAAAPESDGLNSARELRDKYLAKADYLDSLGFPMLLRDAEAEKTSNGYTCWKPKTLGPAYYRSAAAALDKFIGCVEVAA